MAHRDTYRPSYEGQERHNSWNPRDNAYYDQPSTSSGGRGNGRYQASGRDYEHQREQDRFNGRGYEERWDRDVRDDRRYENRNRERSDDGRWHEEDYRGNRVSERQPYHDSRATYDDGLIRFPTPPQGRHNEYHAPLTEQHPPPIERPRRRMNTIPNQSVILIGFPPMTTDEDLKSFIDDFKAKPSDPSPVEQATIVYDKVTGSSKRFGFVRFISLEHARAFVEANYDHVFWKSRGSHDITEDGIKVRIDYASADRRPGESSHQARNVDDDAAPQRPHEPTPADLNNGSKDMGSTPNNTLLLRSLDPLTKETDIARCLEILDEATRERVEQAQGPRRIVLIKDKMTSASWCFAFAIYPDEEAAKASLRTILDPKVFPTGFTIQEKLVAVTFARTGCFTKAYAKTTWSFPDETADGKQQELLYWDEHAYGSIYDSHNYQKALERKREEAAKQSEVDAFFSSLESSGTKLKPEDEVFQAPPSFSIGLSGSIPQSKEKKKPTELIISKKIAVDINKWNQKKAEVASEDDAPPEPANPRVSPLPIKSAADFKPIASTHATIQEPSDRISANDDLQYADMTTNPSQPKCLLCQRQFKTVEVLLKHSVQSDLHKTNLADSGKVEAAKEAVAKVVGSQTVAQASAYRDRALERREAFNQPDYPAPPPKKQKIFLDPPPKPVTSAPEKQIEEDNIGSKLLANMGWTAGSGLGSTAGGRVDPVQAKAFAAGAGIGASRGVAASEQVTDYWRGSEHGRNKARQRMLEEQSKESKAP